MWNNKIAVFLWEFKIYIKSFKLSYSFSKYSRYSNLLNYAAILFFISHIDCLLSFGGCSDLLVIYQLKKIFGPFETLYYFFFFNFISALSFILLPDFHLSCYSFSNFEMGIQNGLCIFLIFYHIYCLAQYSFKVNPLDQHH